MFTRKREDYKRHPTIVAWGIKIVSKLRYLGIMLDCKLDCYPHTQYLESKLLLIHNSLVRCSKAAWGCPSTIWWRFINTPYSQPSHTPQSPGVFRYTKELSANCSKFRDPFLIFITKAYKTVSHEALSAIARIMPIEQAMHLYKDIRAIFKAIPRTQS
jgi:hypothetical protein